MTAKLVSSILLLVLLVGCGSGVGDDAVLATVGDRTITAGEYREAVGRIDATALPDLTTLEGRESLLDDIINKNLLELASYEYFPELPLQIQWRQERARRSLLTNTTRDRLIRNMVVVTEEEKDLAYESAKKDLFLEGILVPEEAMAEALLGRLEEGASFEEVAVDYTMREADPGMEVWELGWTAIGSHYKWPTERALWTAEEGEVVGPLENLEGWWIFRVRESRPAPTEGSREADDARLDDYIREPLYLARARAVQDSLWETAGVEYPVDGQQLLLRKYYWEPPPGMEDDPMAFLNDPRIKPSFPAEEESVVVVSFVDQPDWTAREFADRMEWYGGGMWPRGHSVEQLEEAMDMVVRDHLMIKAGDDLGYSAEPEYREQLESRLNQMRVNVLYNNVITADAEPTEEDIQAWFTENRERYRANPSYRLATFWSADEEAMRELAAEWKEGASFSGLRETYEAKVDDLRFQGDSSWIHMGNDIALDDAVAPVADGEVSEPFLREGTWFVFRVLDRRGERLTAYEEVKDLVDRDAATMAKERALVTFLEEQREKHPVTVDREALETMELPAAEEASAAS